MGLFDTIIADLRNLNVSRYTSAAALVIVLYDHLITFEQEVRLIWPARISIVKVFFLFNRYMVPVCLGITAYELSGLSGSPLSDSFCKQWIAASAYLGLLSLALSNFLLLLRVYAIHEGHRAVLFWLLFSFAVSYIITFITATLGLISLLPHVSYNAVAATCIATSKPTWMAAIWGAPIAFELLTFVLTAQRAWEHRKAYRNSPLLQTLYRDGAVFFIVIIVLRLLNLIIWVVAPISFLFLGVYLIWGLVTVLIARLLLNLRDISTDTKDNDLLSRATIREEISGNHSRRPANEEPMPAYAGGGDPELMLDQRRASTTTVDWVQDRASSTLPLTQPANTRTQTSDRRPGWFDFDLDLSLIRPVQIDQSRRWAKDLYELAGRPRPLPPLPAGAGETVPMRDANTPTAAPGPVSTSAASTNHLWDGRGPPPSSFSFTARGRPRVVSDATPGVLRKRSLSRQRSLTRKQSLREDLPRYSSGASVVVDQSSDGSTYG